MMSLTSVRTIAKKRNEKSAPVAELDFQGTGSGDSITWLYLSIEAWLVTVMGLQWPDCCLCGLFRFLCPFLTLLCLSGTFYDQPIPTPLEIQLDSGWSKSKKMCSILGAGEMKLCLGRCGSTTKPKKQLTHFSSWPWLTKHWPHQKETHSAWKLTGKRTKYFIRNWKTTTYARYRNWNV